MFPPPDNDAVPAAAPFTPRSPLPPPPPLGPGDTPLLLESEADGGAGCGVGCGEAAASVVADPFVAEFGDGIEAEEASGE